MNKKNILLKSFLLLCLTFPISGYQGYKGELPGLSVERQPEKTHLENMPIDKPPFLFDIDQPPKMPANKKAFPELYQTVIIQSNKYNKFKNDLKDFKKATEQIKDLIDENSTNTQLMLAKCNLYHLKIISIKQKYLNKKENNYESFKNLVKLDNLLQDHAFYLKNSLPNKILINNSKMDQLDDEKIKENSLKKINEQIKNMDNSINQI